MDEGTTFTAGEGETGRGAQTWGESEVRAVELGAKSLGPRLQGVAGAWAARPQAPLPPASADWAAPRAA
jgi:hypothetical protein